MNEEVPSGYWFPYEYIEAEFKKKLDKTKGQLPSDKMEKGTKYYMESINHSPNWLKTTIIEIYKLPIDP